MSIGQDVDIRAEDGRIIIEPVRNSVTLEQLLAQITPENVHGAVDFGGPVGNEIL